MAYYEVRIEERNIHLVDQCPAGPCRFETSLRLVAANEVEVLEVARRQVEKHPQLKGRLANRKDDPPLIFTRILGPARDSVESSSCRLDFLPELEHSSPAFWADLFD